MQLIGYSAPQVDLDAIPGLRRVYSWTSLSVQRTTRRAVALTSLIDRAGSALDDIAELRKSAQIIAGSLSELGASAAGIDRNAGKIAEEISGLSTAAQGIDTHAEKLATGIDELVAILPTLQRLTEIVDPLDNTVVRLGRFVDRLPGGRRAQRSLQNPEK
jgi:methyl-accepting chemotaxis protein